MYPEEAKKLALQLLKGDIHSSWKIIHNLDQIGMNSCYIYDQALRNAMYYIGDLWKNNEITVADEHLATGTADIILTRYILEKKGMEPSKRALFFCIEGEEHVLGLKMVSSFFKEKGWDTQFLGANLPLEYVVYSAKKWKPSVIGISIIACLKGKRQYCLDKHLASLS
ncbi:cobalamin B12-binding domain-containing protein [Alkalihalobacterium chitinilyticum]|uniref:cobalamin B12-binding domain-containing protein n=1 Tax=Alkalihalobacterium chitinilyticum TaxID=2980103 RepID=UPI003571325B